ncbi:MAG TPA: hypothetical protein VNK24_09315, partial [Elusimicrobiota bacterium]|nr:hypothetical protein [Elusimicrobiota bacterium]
LSTAIHRKEKEAKRKEERPTTDIFLSSNDNGYLKSGPRWSDRRGAPHSKEIRRFLHRGELPQGFHERLINLAHYNSNFQKFAKAIFETINQ